MTLIRMSHWYAVQATGGEPLFDGEGRPVDRVVCGRATETTQMPRGWHRADDNVEECGAFEFACTFQNPTAKSYKKVVYGRQGPIR